jgi:hypothetical protein
VEAGIRVLVILKGSHVAKGGLALIAIGGLLVKQDLIWISLALVGLMPMEQAVQNSSPSAGQLLIGGGAMLVGALLLASAVITKWRATAPALVALRHQSFDGNSRKLEAADLPPKLKQAEILTLDVDQSALFRNGVLTDPRAALLQQDSLPARLNALLNTHGNASVAYCGKAHIPLAFAAAHLALSEVGLTFFELERGKAGWRWLDDKSAGEDLGLRIEETTRAAPGSEAVIRVEISYGIKEAEVAEIVPSPAADIQIAIAQPRIDCITTVAQVDAIAEAFRNALDKLHAWPTPINRIHVFIAAPKYAWGIEVNAAGGPRVVENGVKAVA